MIFFQKKHIFYSIGLICAAIVLIGSQWFGVDPLIHRVTAFVFFGAVGLSIVTALTPLTGLAAVFLIPLGVALPIGVTGSILYLVGIPLLHVGVSVVIAITALIGIALSHTRPRIHISLRNLVSNSSIQSIGFLICVVCAFGTLTFSQATNAILGPWQAVQSSFFIWYLLAALFLLWSCLKHPLQSHVVLLTLFGLLSTCIAFIMFPLGFGFDPFLHEAAQLHISQFGTLNPKTFYYIGHYALVVLFSKLFLVDISMISRILVPIGSMLTLIPLSIAALKKPILILLFFLLPYPFLIVSTPWGFAYGITIAVVLSSILARDQITRLNTLFIPILSIFSLLIHPLAGIPAIFFSSLSLLYPLFRKQRRSLYMLGVGLWSLAGICAVPAAFVINSLISSQLAVTFAMPHVALPSLITLQSRFSVLLDPVYFYANNLYGILFFSAIPGFFVVWKKGGIEKQNAIVGALAFCVTLVSAFILTTMISFPSLASNEQGDYGMRLVSLAFVFLLPSLYASADLALSYLYDATRPFILTVASTLFIVCGLLTSLYLSYPRNDAFQAFHGYNASAADFDAVKWIYQDSENKEFVVLSNQVVSSALIRTYGFGENSFHYALPTTSPLYAIYSELLRNPTKSAIVASQKLYPNVRTYVVVNEYEPRYPLIVQELKKVTQKWRSFDSDTVMVFVFE